MTNDLLPELLSLCQNSTRASTLLRQFTDGGGMIATFQIDDSATAKAGHLVVSHELGDGFADCLAAMREQIEDSKEAA